MLDLFTIFSKGGIVLWCFQDTAQSLTSSVNALIKSVILQERGGMSSFEHEALTLKYKLDNEFELVFVVAYQKILQLSYVDKFLNEIQMEFRNKYKDDLQVGKISRNFTDFEATFQRILKETEAASREEAKAPKAMRSYDQSDKSKRSVASMIKNRPEEKSNSKKKQAKDNQKNLENTAKNDVEGKIIETASKAEEDTLKRNQEKFFASKMKKSKSSNGKGSEGPKKRVKEARQWVHGGNSKDAKNLDYCAEESELPVNGEVANEEEKQWVGRMRGDLQNMDEESSEEEEEVSAPVKGKPAVARGGFGFLSGLKGLVGAKSLTEEDIKPALNKMRDHLIAKNVAAEIAERLCESVSTRLQGKVLGTFNTVASTVKNALNDSCVQLLSHKRRVDILRDCLEARQQKRPYVVTFCGVNGVGKSTNLAKVAFWLIENGFRVLIAACDTFRAGAVEQLRTHCRKLNALHPSDTHNGQKMVELYEKGYGRDAAGIAMEAVNYARDVRMDVVLVDTAGRMQDNEPLMRALAKLIKVNQPDLVLFVGEALVGNEAVDQLTKFNQALADHSNMETPRLIDGILLTKFDTIDDQVGAAISMTYTTGQPIVFVGTGQTYTDLKNLNAKAVVQSLLRG
ncbi:hypothetical protein CAPTEDRAFT_155737 [Capitella teleta]|uniref:SRP54-type proteins GTP-binding domain-containing protein n=1 Tax=Capitella teleta TaxID=283909 RepID=R7T4J5_CAPTE|nr:hypothetical protein CAPTEDRAFT_155737 [Capitella teleta]|eukprot:ELT87957.1 hypothetical protein CAPTEDRAFT_155737 [Capitella teleta]